MKSCTVGAIVIAALSCACGGTGTAGVTGPSSTNSGGTSFGNGAAPGTTVFSQSPIDISDITEIVPPGNLNPPGHTLPTNHAYFFHRAVANAVVKAPATGTVTTIQRGGDDQLMIAVSPGFEFYIAHVLLDSAIAQGARIDAGQRLGVTASAAGAMDLGVINNAVTVFFVRPERYIAGTLHGDSPLKYFPEPVRGDLYAKVSRAGSDKDGQISFDRAGHLAGNWFTSDLQPSVTENFGNGSKHLSFARDVGDPDRIRISIGGSLSMTGAFFVQAGALDPADVSPLSGLVTYQLYFSPQAQSRAGVLLVQMLADDRLKAEAFANSSAQPTEFTDRAVSYVR
ncbi:MAG TPA: hypothetical protein VJ865_16870 [Gemmatimonadaceae bacterium]|nr:hypothetical protein [Gemmatimonadaceae bacterium]